MTVDQILFYVKEYESELLLSAGIFTLATIMLFVITKWFWLYIFSMMCQFVYLLALVSWGAFSQSEEKLILFVIMAVCFAILNRTRFFQLRARISQLKRMMRIYAEDKDRYNRYKEEYDMLVGR